MIKFYTPEHLKEPKKITFNLGNYLQKFQQFLPFESRVKNIVTQAVQEVVGISLERSKIAVSGSRVTISGSSALRSEIALKQAKIAARMKELEPEIGMKLVG